jgi:DNA invertase Pin-like site-specific DNA recombinase
MATGKFVSYLRVSTKRQGKSGLGLEAQREAVAQHLNGGQWKLLKEFVEVESGKLADRPQLDKALHLCKVTGATLIIAKLDRLSRDAHFLLGMQKASVPFVAADMPEANEMVVGIMAVIAEGERKMISKRTKDALAAAKRRGVKLGNPNGAKHLRRYGNKAAVAKVKAMAQQRAVDLREIVKDIRANSGNSLRAIADGLNQRSIKTPRGGQWHPASAARLIARLSA